MPHSHMAGSIRGRITSGLCGISIHLIAFSTRPGAAQGGIARRDFARIGVAGFPAPGGLAVDDRHLMPSSAR